MKFGKIYLITNDINSKVYVGQTIQTLNKRFNGHCCYSKSDRSVNMYIKRAIHKYGRDKFHIKLLEECPIEKLDEREIYWISFYKSNEKQFGYNILQGGNLGRKGFSKLTKEEVNKIIELDKNRISHIEIGKMFNIDRKSVTLILRRESDYTVKRIRYEDRTDFEEIKEFLKTNPTSREVREKFNIGQNILFKFTKSINYHFLPYNKRKLS